MKAAARPGGQFKSSPVMSTVWLNCLVGVREPSAQAAGPRAKT
jgi:hypothetical protein